MEHTTIGNTHLIDLSDWLQIALSDHLDRSSAVFRSALKYPISLCVKGEHLNPTGSLKDRIVDYIIQRAEQNGQLKKGDCLVESTSGNTGAAVAMLAAQKGYKALLVIPDRVSQEKQAILKALGAEVEVMPSQARIGSKEHYTCRAKYLSDTIPNAFYINQYDSQYNVDAHYNTTGPGIWNQTKGKVDVLVSVMGSGGTISGIGRYLKSKNSKIKVIALDPIGSVYWPYWMNKKTVNCKTAQASLVEGAGSDHVTSVMDFSVIDQVIRFKDVDAFYTARYLAKTSGIVAGSSSGANLWGAMHVAQQVTKPLCIVTLLPDSGLKYLSKFYDDTWMRAHNFMV